MKTDATRDRTTFYVVLAREHCGEFLSKGSTRVEPQRRRYLPQAPMGGVGRLDRHGHDPVPPAQPHPEHELARAKAELDASERYATALSSELSDSEGRVERLRDELEHSQAQLRLLQAVRAVPLDQRRRRTRAKGTFADTAREIARRLTPRR